MGKLCRTESQVPRSSDRCRPAAAGRIEVVRSLKPKPQTAQSLRSHRNFLLIRIFAHCTGSRALLDPALTVDVDVESPVSFDARAGRLLKTSRISSKNASSSPMACMVRVERHYLGEFALLISFFHPEILFIKLAVRVSRRIPTHSENVGPWRRMFSSDLGISFLAFLLSLRTFSSFFQVASKYPPHALLLHHPLHSLRSEQAVSLVTPSLVCACVYSAKATARSSPSGRPHPSSSFSIKHARRLNPISW